MYIGTLHVPQLSNESWAMISCSHTETAIGTVFMLRQVTGT